MLSHFQGVPIFAGMSEEAILLLVKRAKEERFQPGAVIVQEGESGNRFFLLAEGEVRVVKQLGAAHEVELARLKTRDFFGEMCILETLPRSASVQALAPTQVFSVSSFDFLQLYNKLPAQYGILVLNVARDLSRRLRHLDEAFAAKG